MIEDARGTDTVGALAAERPGAAELFEGLGLDYCCGGEVALHEACAERGLELAEVLGSIAQATGETGATAPAHDLAGLSIGELCEHIVVHRHGPLRVTLARLTKLLATVARVHGDARPELHELEGTFLSLRADVEEHLLVEERTLFPACATLDGALPDLDDELLGHLRDDHRDVGAGLGQLRELSGDWDESRARCATHRELLVALRGFERDMHRHIHEENNILFPRVLEQVGTSAD